MELRRLLFDFRGRIGRSAFWLGTIFDLVCIALTTTAIVTLVRLYAASRSSASSGGVDEALVTVAVLILGLIGALFAGSLLAVQVKRWRDRDKNWLWILMGLVPVVGPFWVLIECGLMPCRQRSTGIAPVIPPE